MASEMTFAFREFARKKLNEAKQKGASLASVTTASLASSVPAPTSFGFRSNAASQPTTISEDLPLEKKLKLLRTSFAAHRNAIKVYWIIYSCVVR